MAHFNYSGGWVMLPVFTLMFLNFQLLKRIKHVGLAVLLPDEQNFADAGTFLITSNETEIIADEKYAGNIRRLIYWSVLAGY